MRDKRKSRWLQGCRLALSVMALGQFIATPRARDRSRIPGLPSPSRAAMKPARRSSTSSSSSARTAASITCSPPTCPTGPARPSTTCSPRASSSSTRTKTRFRDRTSQKAHQAAATGHGPADAFLLSPPQTNFPNNQLPAPLVGGAKVSYITNECGSSPITSCEAIAGAGAAIGIRPADRLLPVPAERRHRPDLKTPDQRITNVNALPAGPFQLTSSTMPVRLLFGKPGTSLLSDVAAAELQHIGGRPWQPVGMQRQPVRLGRSDRRRRNQRRNAARQFQHRIFSERDYDGRRLDGAWLL